MKVQRGPHSASSTLSVLIVQYGVGHIFGVGSMRDRRTYFQTGEQRRGLTPSRDKRSGSTDMDMDQRMPSWERVELRVARHNRKREFTRPLCRYGPHHRLTRADRCRRNDDLERKLGVPLP